MLRRTLHVLEVLSALAGLALFFVDNGRQWMSAHGLWGWAVAIVGIVAGVLTAEVRTRGDTHRVDLEVALAVDAEAKEAAAEALRRDAALLHERLDGWTVKSDFFRYLGDDANHSYFPSKRHDEMFRRIRAWEVDPRQLKTPQLRAAFERVKQAVFGYDRAVLQNMWRIERELSDGKIEVDWDHMWVPPEWEDEYPDKYQAAMKSLNGCCDELSDALGNLFRLMHDLGIDEAPEPTVLQVDEEQTA
jgi:hypothetical protein